MKVVYLGGKQAGLIGLLAVKAFGCRVDAVVPRGDLVGNVARKLGCSLFDSVKDGGLRIILRNADLIVSVHSKEIVPIEILKMPRLGGINVHPCLYRYKGSNPITRFLSGSETMASIGVHFMSEEVDCGEVINEIFVEIDKEKVNTLVEVYNVLYPIYAEAILDALEILNRNG